MQTKLIARINNVDIIATSDEQLIPIKPICEALGIDSNGQKQRIERDEILNPVACMIHATGKDGKTYEMFAIPYKYTFGWIFSVDVSKVNPDSKENVLRYKEECYSVLYDHFTAPKTFLKQKQEVMEQLVKEYQSCQQNFKEAKNRMNDAKTKLNEIMNYTIEEWKMNNKQLCYSFAPHEDEE